MGRTARLPWSAGLAWTRQGTAPSPRSPFSTTRPLRRQPAAPVPAAERKRLVQRRSRSPSRAAMRPRASARATRRRAIRHPQRERLAQRHMPGPGGQPEREQRSSASSTTRRRLVRPQRLHALRTRTVGTTTRSPSPSWNGLRLDDRLLRRAEGATPGPTAPRRPSAGRAATRPGTSAPRRTRSSTRRRLWRPPARRARQRNGWFAAPLTVSFSGTDATSTIDSCDAQKSYSGPDTASTAVAGACRDKAGNASSASFVLKYDATAPAATASPSRAPNANGWFNAPLNVSFAGTDTTSTIDSCDAQKSYSGPDAVSTAVSGTCRDKAGNLERGSKLRVQVRRDGARNDRNTISPAERERLVPGSSLRDLYRWRCDVDDRLLRRPEDLLRA